MEHSCGLVVRLRIGCTFDVLLACLRVCQGGQRIGLTKVASYEASKRACDVHKIRCVQETESERTWHVPCAAIHGWMSQRWLPPCSRWINGPFDRGRLQVK